MMGSEFNDEAQIERPPASKKDRGGHPIVWNKTLNKTGIHIPQYSRPLS
jgi:hypothetical protein